MTEWSFLCELRHFSKMERTQTHRRGSFLHCEQKMHNRGGTAGRAGQM